MDQTENDSSGNKLALIKIIKDALNSEQQEQDKIISNETGKISNDQKDSLCEAVSNDHDRHVHKAFPNTQDPECNFNVNITVDVEGIVNINVF